VLLFSFLSCSLRFFSSVPRFVHWGFFSSSSFVVANEKAKTVNQFGIGSCGRYFFFCCKRPSLTRLLFLQIKSNYKRGKSSQTLTQLPTKPLFSSVATALPRRFSNSLFARFFFFFVCVVPSRDSVPFSTQYVAKVIAVGHECDLALLTVEDPTFWEGLQPVQFGGIPVSSPKSIFPIPPITNLVLRFFFFLVFRIYKMQSL
jgi:hypothetical protein